MLSYTATATIDTARPAAGGAARSRRTLARPERVGWVASIPSLGLSLDTPYGPVDLVAIERAVRGHTVALSAAEYAWLRYRTSPEYGRDVAADRLGIDRARFAQLLRRWREEHYPADPAAETDAA